MHNDYLPITFRGDKFLKEAGDLSDKVWDEEQLLRWEQEDNCGQPWEGRRSSVADIEYRCTSSG